MTAEIPAEPQSQKDLPSEPTARQSPGPADHDSQTVNLASVIADEFGMSHDDARELIQTGTMMVDGEVVAMQHHMPLDMIKGKTLSIQGRVRSIQFTYTP